MKKLEVALVVGLIILLVSVLYEPNSLGDKYYYMDEYTTIDVGYPYGQIIYKSKDKYNGVYSIDKIIDANIKEVKYNSNYIIALQYPNKKIIIKELEDNILFWYDYYKENKKDSIIKISFGEYYLSNLISINDISKLRIKIIVDSIVENNTYYKKLLKNKINYYIIDKKKDSVYGPFNKKEFIDFKEKKNIDLDF